MIEIKTIGVFGFEGAIRGCRMPYESFDKSDSRWWDCKEVDCENCTSSIGINDCLSQRKFFIGEADMALCKKLIKSGSEHRKFLRMIHVQAEAKAPRYFTQELATYKVGTAMNSSSTMHLITKRVLTLDDFSHDEEDTEDLKQVIDILNRLITDYQTYSKRPDAENKKNKINGIFKRIKGILPESFMQKFVFDCNYEVLLNIYRQRKNHRLPEWSGENGFCSWLKGLPYMESFLE